MRRLQLYIGTERVDLFKDESVSLTQTIKNVKDLKKVFTEFTQTFSVPASSVNNKIFKHYYNFDISGGFDARNKVEASLELNDLPFKTGLIALQGVDLKNNLAHTYKITFYGNTVNLKDILGADQLASLSDLNQYSLEYNYANIKAKLETGGGPLIAPLLTHTNRLFYDSSNTNIGANNLFYNSGSTYNGNGVLWSELKFAITLQAIIDAIQVKYTTENLYQSSIVFSDDFFNNTANVDFNYLFMWLHRKKGDVETTTAQGGFSWTPVTLGVASETGEQVIGNISNGSVTIGGDFINGYGETPLSITPIGSGFYSIRIMQDGAVYEQRSNVQNTQLFFQTEAETLPAGTYSIEIAADTTTTFDAGDISWRFELYNTAPETAGVAIVQNPLFDTDLQNQFTITEQIPKMKIIDFLTAIFKMFNLTAYVDDVGTIVVRTLDSYYAASTTVYNIDKYLDTTTSKVDIALPFKEIFFSYKGLGTILAEKYNQINNIEWGTEKYTPTNTQFTTPSESYKVEVPFEHMMFERLPDVDTFTNTEILYGVCIDDNLEPYIGEPLIFYREFTPFFVDQTPIALKETEASAPDEITTYNMPSNSWSLNPATSTSNINFSNEFNEYTLSTDFTGTLFNNYYLNYIKDVFNTQRRLTKVTAYLPMKVYYNLKLNDLIEIGQDTYKINSLTTDLTTGKTEFELLNTIL